MSKTWFTSDLHFNHRNIITYCNRPFADVETMNRELIRRWNEVVGPDDLVYVLGDVAMSHTKPDPLAPLVARLNGSIKWLIGGNHDKGKEQMRSLGFDVVTKKVLTSGIRDGYTVLMHHDPEDALQDPNLADANLVLCGHVHSHWRTKVIADIRFINVGVDVWDYYPVSLETLLTAPTLPEPRGAERQVGSAYL